MQLAEIMINLRPGETLLTVVERNRVIDIVEQTRHGVFTTISRAKEAAGCDVPDMIVVRNDEIISIGINIIDDEEEEDNDG